MPDARAHTAVRTAIIAGRLPAPAETVCGDCGRRASVYHHHSGYAPEHWLSVEPLCRSCHKRRHPKAPRRAEHATSIRVRPEVAEEVRANAAAARRSLNREIELYVEEALARRRRGRAARAVREGPGAAAGRAEDALQDA